MDIRRRGRLGIYVLVRVPAVPVVKDLPEAGEYAPCRSGLFRPLRSPAYEGTLVCSGRSFKTGDQRGEVSGGCVSGHEGGVCWVPGVRSILQE